MATSDPATDYWPKDWVKCPVCGFLTRKDSCIKDPKACAKRVIDYITRMR